MLNKFSGIGFIFILLLCNIALASNRKISIESEEKTARYLYDFIKHKARADAVNQYKSNLFLDELSVIKESLKNRVVNNCLFDLERDDTHLEKAIKRGLNNECIEKCLKQSCVTPKILDYIISKRDSLSNKTLDKVFEHLEARPETRFQDYSMFAQYFSEVWLKKNNPNAFSNIINSADKNYFKNELKHIIKEIESAPTEASEQKVQEMLAFVFNNYKFLDQKYTVTKLVSLARKFTTTKQLDLGATIYSFLFTLDPSETEHITTNLLWSLLFSGREAVAQKYIQEKQKSFDNVSSTELAFWLTYVSRQSADKTESIQIVKPGINFYSLIDHFLSSKQIEIPEGTEINIAPFLKSEIYAKKTQRFRIWSKLALDHYALMELSEYFNQSDCKSTANTCNQLVINLFREIIYPTEYLTLFKLSYSLMESEIIKPSKLLLKELFPKKHYETLAKHAKTVDPYLALALTRQESSFNPGTVSHAGAIGLMQIMPNTAKGMVKASNIKRRLKEPDFNIKYGIKYLEKLLQRYEGDYVKAIAGYNAGPHRVDSWATTVFSNSDPLISIESIPFEETRNYVKLVIRNFLIYKYLYNDEFKIEDEVAIVLPNLKR